MSTNQNKKCGKCEKIVYPAEEIKCLDKFWHKGCLKCTVCGMTLNVKNVKGYDKMPYCAVHYPQPKPTVVADNPEMQRIRLLTDIQSNAKYHEDFNKSKGKFTVVADDPALTRAKEHQRLVSQAEYTGKRKESNSQLITQDNYHHQHQLNGNNRTSHTSEQTIGRGNLMFFVFTQYFHRVHDLVADYDPLNDDRGSLARGYEPTSKAIHTNKFEINQKSNFQSGTKSDHNHGNGNGNGNGNGHAHTNKIAYQSYTKEQEYSTSNPHHNDQIDRYSNGDGGSAQMKVRAIYSYTAAESDEISFIEGDILDQCEHIDAGWMLGRNPKTGQQGLLPSNYVEIIG